MAILISAVIFQNCGPNIRLTKLPETTQLSVTEPFKAIVCPEYLLQPPSNTKFLFIVDMSASNVGEFQTKPNLSGSYWIEEVGTDVAGDRFDAIKNFITTCAQNSSNKFAIIGFAGTAGSLVAADSSEMLCTSQFVETNEALANINIFKQHQQAFRSWMTRYKNKPYDGEPINFAMTVTSYDSAINCVTNLFTEDLTGNLENTSENYQFFFVSDGAPRDKKDTGCEAKTITDKEACYKGQIHNGITFLGQLASAGQRSLRFTPIGYGPNSAQIGTYLDYMAGEFDGSKAALLSDFKTNQNAFCTLLASRSGIEFRPDFTKAVNLTTRRTEGSWQPDSDMDGLIDQDDPDPLNPRSLVPGVLDGICQRLGGAGPCLNKRPLGCSQDVDIHRLLSDCDVRILGLPGKASGPSWGVDSDRDGLPDYIEIIKGLNPADQRDALADPDSDGLSNLNEILQGSDPFRADNQIPSYELNLVTNRFVGTTPLDPTCTNGGAWEMTLQRMSGVDGLSYIDSQIPNRSHAPSHQVAMLYYSRGPGQEEGDGDQFLYTLSRFSLLSQRKLVGNAFQTQIFVTPIDSNPVASNKFCEMAGAGGCP